ncbi:hypothetical protein [Microbacterium sp. JZ31]|uniref:hypothetical protein n=1 Tax=Microbacterium sp. JZ31 TaxID=1906274 RepID=UPI001EE3E7A2|nr:hypothetical protein [Microbacterium sp. JZ31]
MGELQTMVRTELSINGRSFYLAQGQDIAHLKRRIEAGAHSAAFVDFTIVGNGPVSVLITSSSEVVLSVETVQFDPRDTGDEEFPYGGAFDGI